MNQSSRRSISSPLASSNSSPAVGSSKCSARARCASCCVRRCVRRRACLRCATDTLRRGAALVGAACGQGGGTDILCTKKCLTFPANEIRLRPHFLIYTTSLAQLSLALPHETRAQSFHF